MCRGDPSIIAGLSCNAHVHDMPGGIAAFQDARFQACPAATTARELLRSATGGNTMFGVIGWIVFGLVVGALAKLVMPGRDPGGVIITMLLGVVGAVVGGWLGRAVGMYGPNEPAGFLMSLVGAVLLLAVYRMAVGCKRIV
jgi:uncharacterized membrane protein YeaQ/YmgE (transglycosylase-associated protein family)